MAKIGKRKMKRSKRTELARQVIASDFQVQPVEEDEGWILFAAERKDFFHFVEYNETDGNTTTQPHINHLAVTQHHIPHLAFARAMDFMQSTGHEYVAPVQGRIEIMPQARGEMFLVIRGSAVLLSSLAAGLEERIKRVSSTLATARKRVVCEDGRYLIPGATTHHGNPLSSVSKDLIEGIAFEKVLRRRLNARNFGLYSAFCTHVDSPCALHDMDRIKEFVDTDLTPESVDRADSSFRKVARAVQRRLFPYPVWGRGIKIDSAKACDALHAAVAKLNPVQATQVVLLNGMHNAHILLALAVVTGLASFEYYKAVASDGYPPDSEEMQSLCVSASFIQLFGEVAGGCSGHADPRPTKRIRNKRKVAVGKSAATKTNRSGVVFLDYSAGS
jgi:hypothetical protein